MFEFFFQTPSVKEADDEDLIKALKKMKSLIVQNSSTALREPDLFVGQNTLEQVDQVLDKYPDVPYGIVRCGLKFIYHTYIPIRYYFENIFSHKKQKLVSHDKAKRQNFKCYIHSLF